MLFPMLANLVVSCCNCEDPAIFHYTYKTLGVKNLDNSGSEVRESSAGAILKTAYGIRLLLGRQKTARHQVPRGFFVSAAYAQVDCFCPPPRQFEPRDSITAIKVMTLTAFDNSHPVNADVSDFFRVYKPYAFATIPEALTSKEKVLYDESELPDKIDLLLMTAPAINTRHQFKVQVYLSDGRVLEADTPLTDLI